MLLANQLRPYEKEPGAVEKCRTKWVFRLSRELMQGKGLTLGHMQKVFREIALDFSRIETTGEKKQRVGILGDIYTKYCHLGNWNVVRFLEEEGCESSVGGLSWYVLYYIDSHKPEGKPLTGAVFDLVGRLVLHLQKSMLRALGGLWVPLCFGFCGHEAGGSWVRQPSGSRWGRVAPWGGGGQSGEAPVPEGSGHSSLWVPSGACVWQGLLSCAEPETAGGKDYSCGCGFQRFSGQLL